MTKLMHIWKSYNCGKRNMEPNIFKKSPTFRKMSQQWNRS